MAALLDVPAWLSARIDQWVHVLRLRDWEITTKMALCVSNNPGCIAACTQQPNVNAAHLTFRVDIEDNEEFGIAVSHELLHVSHTRIDEVVEDIIIASLPEGQREIAQKMYDKVLESWTDHMARALYDLCPSPRESQSTEKENPIEMIGGS